MLFIRRDADLFKGRYGSANKHHKYIRRYRGPDGEWVHVYADKEGGEVHSKQYAKWVAKILMTDGTKVEVLADADEVDDEGKLVGGKKTLRALIARKLFGEAGFDEKGHFWKRKGLLFDYSARVNKRGKVTIEREPTGRKFVDIELRDGTLAHLYGGELPAKYAEHQADSGDVTGHVRAPEPVEGKVVGKRPDGRVVRVGGEEGESIEMEELDTSDTPYVESGRVETIAHVPTKSAGTKLALGEPLEDDEDPVKLAAELLKLTLEMPTSRAKTKVGRARHRDRRSKIVEGTHGKRKLQPLPPVALAKFDGPEDLQAAMTEQPLSAFITLGMWDKFKPYGNQKKQLVAEYQSFIRWTVRRAMGAFRLTDTYAEAASADEKRGRAAHDEKSAVKKYMGSMQRELTQIAITTLLDEAKKYVATDEPHGPKARFDRAAKNRIMSIVYEWSRDVAKEQGARGIVSFDAEDSDALQALEGQSIAAENIGRVLTPKEAFELKHHGPIARRFIDTALETLPPEQRLAFSSRLWLDDPHTGTDVSEETKFAEARLRQAKKKGGSTLHWGRPWTGEKGHPSVAQKLKDVKVTLTSGEVRRLGDLGQEHQKYYVQKWYAEARDRIKHHFQDAHGNLTPTGHIVERWLRLEAKLADANRREISERRLEDRPEFVSRPGLALPKMPLLHEAPAKPTPEKRPELHFFSKPGSNQQLAHKLGINPSKFEDHVVPHVRSAGTDAHHHMDQAKRWHVKIELARKVKDIDKRLAQAHAQQQTHADVGHWEHGKHGATWHESEGVQAFHHAAQKFQVALRSKDVVAAETAAREYQRLEARVHPVLPQMAVDYNQLIQSSTPITDEHLVPHKARAHAAYRAAQNEVFVYEYEKERRHSVKKGLVSEVLLDALDDYDFAFGRLYAVLH